MIPTMFCFLLSMIVCDDGDDSVRKGKHAVPIVNLLKKKKVGEVVINYK